MAIGRDKYEVIYETQHAGIVPVRAGARIRLLKAAVVFARRAEPGSSSGGHVIAQFKHDADHASGPN